MRLIFCSCLLTASLASMTGCNGNEPSPALAAQSVRARVVSSWEEQAPVSIRATGSLRAKQSAIISAQVAGRIEQVLVQEGDSVRAGQTLAVLDDAGLRASSQQAEAGVTAAQSQLAAAKAEADLAASTYERYKQLQAQKSVSPQELDEVARRAEASAGRMAALRAQADAAKAQETGARTMLDYTRVRASSAGVVTARLADPGTLASPGIPLFKVDSAGPLQLQVTVDESAIASVRRGMTVPVSIDGATITGTVDQIVPAADPSSRGFQVKLNLPSSENRHAGMYGTAAFKVASHAAILIPRSAVVLRGSLACAYVLDEKGVAQLRYVALGAAHDSSVEVLSGISAGEKLVDDPADRDLAGRHVEAQP